MDSYATLDVPPQTLFGHLANPVCMGDWLPQIVRVDPGPPSLIGLGTAFTVTVRVAGGDLDLDAEIAAHEPPWLIAYRLMATGPVLIRATCTADAAGTRVHVRQTEGAAPLLVDLPRLRRALTGTGGPAHL